MLLLLLLLLPEEQLRASDVRHLLLLRCLLLLRQRRDAHLAELPALHSRTGLARMTIEIQGPSCRLCPTCRTSSFSQGMLLDGMLALQT